MIDFVLIFGLIYNSITDNSIMKRVEKWKIEQEYFAVIDEMVKSLDDYCSLALDVYTGSADAEINKEYIVKMASYYKMFEEFDSRINEIQEKTAAMDVSEEDIADIGEKAAARFRDKFDDSEYLFIMDSMMPGFSNKIEEWINATINSLPDTY